MFLPARPLGPSRTVSAIRWSRIRFALLAVALACLPLGGFLCDDNDSAIEGTKDGTERWIVYLEGEAPDLSAYREAAKAGPKAQADLAEKMKAETKVKHAPFVKMLAERGGTVIEHWWMTNAVTVEIPEGTSDAVSEFEGVKRIAPDVLLGD